MRLSILALLPFTIAAIIHPRATVSNLIADFQTVKSDLDTVTARLNADNGTPAGRAAILNSINVFQKDVNITIQDANSIPSLSDSDASSVSQIAGSVSSGTESLCGALKSRTGYSANVASIKQQFHTLLTRLSTLNARTRSAFISYRNRVDVACSSSGSGPSPTQFA